MTLRIDRAGRVVLPKLMRDRHGLRAGVDLEVEETSEGILLKPAAQKPPVTKKGKFLVFTGEVAPGYDLTQAIAEDRDDRERKAWGS